MRYRLRRRGIDHGHVAPRPRELDWRRAEPIVFRDVCQPPNVAALWRIITKLRGGADLAHLVRAPRGFRFAGTSQSMQDPLELQKLHVEPGALYIKVNWLSTVPGDGSLRLRFSYGLEVLDDWVDDPIRTKRVLQLIEGLFPECRNVRKRMLPKVRATLGFWPRIVQPILYANAANGGALFHHDYVPGQTAVFFTQFVGATGWLALPKRELARAVQVCSKRRGVLKRLDERDAKIERLINHVPSFTQRLAAEGWFFVLKAGDGLLLPSHGEDDVAWHSVFTIGRGSNLALSVGLVR